MTLVIVHMRLSLFVYSVTSHPVCGSDFHNAGCDFSRQPQKVREEDLSAPEGWDSGKYLVVVEVVGQTPNEQFVWRIRNNRGDDACGRQQTQSVCGEKHGSVMQRRSVTHLGRGTPAALRYQVGVGNREVV